MKKIFLFALLIPALCQSQSILQKGIWHAGLQLNDSTVLPFRFEVREKAIYILNGDERIAVTEIVSKVDSIFIRMPVFDAELRCKVLGDSLTGHFFN